MALELGNGQRLKECWGAWQKKPGVPWRTLCNTDVNICPGESSEGSEEHGRENIFDLRKQMNCHEQTDCG